MTNIKTNGAETGKLKSKHTRNCSFFLLSGCKTLSSLIIFMSPFSVYEIQWIIFSLPTLLPWSCFITAQLWLLLMLFWDSISKVYCSVYWKCFPLFPAEVNFQYFTEFFIVIVKLFRNAEIKFCFGWFLIQRCLFVQFVGTCQVATKSQWI